jgi:hypothetical protein
VIPIPILSGATHTLINGMPAARCGDMGLGIWCGGYFPMYEIFLGSSNVWIEGCRAARVLCDITKHCIFTTPKPSDFPLYTFLGLTMTSSPNVIIGGVPMPSLTNIAVGVAFKAVFAGVGRILRGLRRARSAADEIHRFDRIHAFQKIEADPARRVMGPAWRSHPEEVASMRRTIEDAGVEVIERPDALAYAPGLRRGEPGQFYIDPNASYSAWLHEYQHFLDDQAAGWGVRAAF